jgi:hemerythrin-like domain-containing protein
VSQSPIGFRAPAAGFDDPVELWLACHERVRRFCRLLQRLPAHLAAHGADKEAQEAARSVRRYFNEAAPRHHADEETDLFPRLLRRAPARRADPLRVTLAALEAEHAVNDARWRRLDEALAHIAAGAAVTLDAAALEDFVRSYEAHIGVEESVVLEGLREWLDESDWRAIGAAMAQRRGATWNAPR